MALTRAQLQSLWATRDAQKQQPVPQQLSVDGGTETTMPGSNIPPSGVFPPTTTIGDPVYTGGGAPAADGVTAKEPTLPPMTTNVGSGVGLPPNAFSGGTPVTTEFVNGPGNTGPIGQPPVSGPLPPAQSFGPGENLIGTQINPTADPRLQQTQGQVNALQQGVLDRYNQMGTPDRQALALESLRLLDEQTADTRRLGTQQIGRDAARLGRLGSGMVTTDLGNLEERLNISRDRAMRDLANETAGYKLDDQLRGLGAGQGILEQYSGLEGQQYGQGAQGREELRGERGYQQYLDQQAIDNWLKQQGFANQLSGSWLDQDLAYNSMFGSPGYASTSPIYGQLAGQYGQQAAGGMGASSDLLQALMAGGYLK